MRGPPGRHCIVVPLMTGQLTVSRKQSRHATIGHSSKRFDITSAYNAGRESVGCVKYQVGCIIRCLTNDLVFKITNGEQRSWDFVFIFRRTHAYLHLTLYCTSTPKLHERSLKATARCLLHGQHERQAQQCEKLGFQRGVAADSILLGCEPVLLSEHILNYTANAKGSYPNRSTSNAKYVYLFMVHLMKLSVTL